MRILLDHRLPRRLRHSFSQHTVSTTAEMGWEKLRNGKLLAAAATQFDIFLTIDKNLKNEQNLKTLPVAVIVIMAPSNRLDDLLPFVPKVLNAIDTIAPHALLEVS